MMTKRIGSMVVGTCLGLILALSACGGAGGEALAGTAWELASLSGSAPLPGTAITIEFAEETFSGSGGCNHYGGTYRIAGDGLSVSEVYATEMACMEPAGVMAQESAYLAVLRTADSYRVAEDRLEMMDGAGTTILAFVTPRPEAGAQAPAEGQATPDLAPSCTLAMEEAYQAGEPVTLYFELNNATGRPVSALRWYTPLEGMAGEMMAVTRDGVALAYEGPLAKRADPSRDEYITLAPGGGASASVDLTEGYDLSAPGSYQVRFTAGLQDVTDDEAAVPRKRDDHQPQPLSCNTVSFRIEPAPEPPTVEATPVPSEEAGPAEATAVPEPPAGFQAYQDPVAGVAVWIPEGWVVTQVFPGESAIMQSYPEDKYVGGEAREPGDTKCDLTVRPADVSLEGHMAELRANPGLTVVSEEAIVLQSGEPGFRVEVESMGPSLSLITAVNGRVVVLTCFGEPAPFDEIAPTVSAME